MTGFDDGKDEGALRTIGEVSEALGIKPHVLRYWEAQFPLLKPLKRSGGRRYYRPADVALVETIDRLVNREGYTLKGAEAVLDVAPIAGRLVCFRADVMEHEVLTAHKTRYSLTGWMLNQYKELKFL